MSCSTETATRRYLPSLNTTLSMERHPSESGLPPSPFTTFHRDSLQFRLHGLEVLFDWVFFAPFDYSGQFRLQHPTTIAAVSASFLPRRYRSRRNFQLLDLKRGRVLASELFVGYEIAVPTGTGFWYPYSFGSTASTGRHCKEFHPQTGLAGALRRIYRPARRLPPETQGSQK